LVESALHGDIFDCGYEQIINKIGYDAMKRRGVEDGEVAVL
jgi:hypothetical protein